MTAGENASAHTAGVVLQFHFQECRTHAGHLTRALARAAAEAHAARPEAEQRKPGNPQRQRNADAAQGDQDDGCGESRGTG